MAGKRRLLYVLATLVLGAAVAFAIVLWPSGATDSVADGSVTSSTSFAVGDDTTVDPAKQEPLLDKFTSKDPFIPLPTSSATPAPTSSPTTPANQTNLTARVTLAGTSYTVAKGDEIPSGSPVFSVSAVATDSVTFKLVNGEFTNGDTSVVVGVGESVKVTKEGGGSYILKVVSIGSSGSASQAGHTLKVLSITESDGTAYVTLEIDGQTYADKKVGDTFSTGWGEVEILAVNVGAQTVTLMRGDQTITLSAGQSVVK